MKFTSKGSRVGIVLMGVLLLAAGNVFAQRGPGGGGQPPSPPSASDLVSRMKTALNLTDDQASQVTTIIQNEISQMESLMKSGNPESGRTQMESIHQQTESKLAEVLTAEQLTKWKSSMSQKPQGGGGNRPSAGNSESSSFGGSSRSSSGSGIY